MPDDCDSRIAADSRGAQEHLVSLEQLAHAGVTEEAAERLRAVEHSMALEDQAVGDIDTRAAKKPRRVS